MSYIVTTCCEKKIPMRHKAKTNIWAPKKTIATSKYSLQVKCIYSLNCVFYFTENAENHEISRKFNEFRNKFQNMHLANL